MLQKADTNNDGKITLEDFYTVMVKTYCWSQIQLIIINYSVKI